MILATTVAPRLYLYLPVWTVITALRPSFRHYYYQHQRRCSGRDCVKGGSRKNRKPPSRGRGPLALFDGANFSSEARAPYGRCVIAGVSVFSELASIRFSVSSNMRKGAIISSSLAACINWAYTAGDANKVLWQKCSASSIFRWRIDRAVLCRRRHGYSSREERTMAGRGRSAASK